MKAIRNHNCFPLVTHRANLLKSRLKHNSKDNVLTRGSISKYLGLRHSLPLSRLLLFYVKTMIAIEKKGIENKEQPLFLN